MFKKNTPKTQGFLLNDERNRVRLPLRWRLRP